MHIRLHTLWRVPVYCLISSYVSFYVTTYLGSAFFVVRTEGAARCHQRVWRSGPECNL